MSAGKKVLSDYPHLMEQWDYEKNKGLDPHTIKHRSRKVVWWVCPKGHKWQTAIGSRTYHNSGCPFCAKCRADPDSYNLEITHPNLVKEWHPTLNLPLSPSDITQGSARKVWWRCGQGHVWQATINNRVHGSTCPYCSGKRPIPGQTDLATTHPDLVKEWHPILNLPLTPSDVSKGARRKVWWQCTEGHEWRAQINSRSDGARCPTCSNKYRRSGLFKKGKDDENGIF